MNTIPEGRYLAACSLVDGQSIQWGPATDKSPFTAAVALTIAKGEYAGITLTKFFYFGNTIDKGGKTGEERSLEALRVIGFTGDDIDKFCDQMPSNLVDMTVQHQQYNGKTQVQVWLINRPGAGGGFVLKEKLDARELRANAAKLKAKLARIPEVKGEHVDVSAIQRGQGGAGAQASSSDEPPFPSDDDVGF